MPKVLCVLNVVPDELDLLCDDGVVYPFHQVRDPEYYINHLNTGNEIGFAGTKLDRFIREFWGPGIELRKPSENIYDYYVERLNDTPDDESLRELPIDSGCGEPCKDAIDYASGLLRHLKDAHGNNKPHLEQQLLNVVNDIVVCYWRG
jgi:hypothetical protein